MLEFRFRNHSPGIIFLWNSQWIDFDGWLPPLNIEFFCESGFLVCTNLSTDYFVRLSIRQSLIPSLRTSAVSQFVCPFVRQSVRHDSLIRYDQVNGYYQALDITLSVSPFVRQSVHIAGRSSASPSKRSSELLCRCIFIFESDLDEEI